MKAIILARVSTEEQKEAGNSLPAQIDRLKKYCQNKGFEVAKVFSFDESAYKVKRDDFDGALEYLKSAKEKVSVCFDKVDRFSRNVFDKRVAVLYELAMKDKIELHFASDNLVITPDISAAEKFHFGINLGLAKYYSDAISDNVKRAYENKIKKGEWIGKAPIGYVNVENETGSKEIQPDQLKAPFIVKIFEMYATGNYSLLLIKDEMKESGLKGNTKLNKPLTKSMIFHILRNSFYYGMMKIKGELYQHKYEPLISKFLFDRCQAVRESYHKKPFKYAGKAFVLRGLIKCAVCGCTITPEEQKGHNYYSCTNHKGIHAKRLYIKENDLLEPIYKSLESLKLSEGKINDITEDLKQLHESKNQFHEQAIVRLSKEHELIEAKIQRLWDLRLEDDPCITKDLFADKLKQLKEEQTEIRMKSAQYDKADEKFYITANVVLNMVRSALDIFKSSEPAEKRQMLNFIFQNFQLSGKKLDYALREPFDSVAKYANCPTLLRR
ncbi:MAG: hypothetical protein COV34_03280 [Candidatus Zambryskibacteria bacterium CG10_big_fil_rev_8_21_14_0_10_42_12]|uniref:Recombinase family protein n=1 Tax=Candidatus Zambryskibacteria bacterium CG10_big_fil_rev_8_21_14_0_10_42_12 TaxID=1975115 RepID=A0A2H0QU13_9BACT|nr:MAG: hypothetical protein COV34_03280 [Candidatus Zambryskibacteria bacterium CG10_big_fil_rev_8_21_14_0_10_42_12]